jgi:hypothetical protein
MNTRCPWCRTPVTDEDPDPDTLCRPHLAELEGLSESELDRMESEQYAEEADSRGWL